MAVRTLLILSAIVSSACGGSNRKDLNRGQHAVCAAGSDQQQAHPAPETFAPALERTVKVGDVERHYRVFVPAGLDKAQSVPLVSIHHGYTMSDAIMEKLTSWKAIAQREKFVVAFAQGADGDPWNVGENVCGAGKRVAALTSQDDLGFLKAIITDAASIQAIDTLHVFVGGFSMGGYFANHVGCTGRDFVRAVAAHSGGTYAGDCPGKPIPVLIIHGDEDSLIRYSCGQEAHDGWAARNGCSANTRCEPIAHGVCDWNLNCPAGQDVGLCTLKGMSHGWAGAEYTGPWLFRQYGGGAEFADGAELMWKFFARTL